MTKSLDFISLRWQKQFLFIWGIYEGNNITTYNYDACPIFVLHSLALESVFKNYNRKLSHIFVSIQFKTCCWVHRILIKLPGSGLLGRWMPLTFICTSFSFCCFRNLHADPISLDCVKIEDKTFFRSLTNISSKSKHKISALYKIIKFAAAHNKP